MYKGIDFKVPSGLIAQKPVHPRDSAKLLVYNRATQGITHTTFRCIGEYLPKSTTLVANNARVDKCRLLFPGVEIFLLSKLDDTRAEALVKPGRKFKLGTTLQLTDSLTASVKAIADDGVRTLEFSQKHDAKVFQEHQHIPLPPYIAQDDTLSSDYQTVYARHSGSKAAPTAGLHFTDKLLAELKEKFIFAELTLDVGLGTFAPLSEQNFKDKTLHCETFSISPENADAINSASHITAIGTTSLRVLESGTKVLAGRATTDIFITPGYKFRRTDSLVTNFHLPGTSLLLLVEAFIGSTEQMKRVYDEALTQKYRFYSFGDAMLIL